MLKKGYEEYTCKCCPDKFVARVADRKRGWARFCNKSCAAYFKKYGKRRPHQTPEMLLSAASNNILRRVQSERCCYQDDGLFSVYGEGWDEHKDYI